MGRVIARGYASRADLLIMAVGLMTLTYVWRIQDILPLLRKLSPALLATVAALAIWALDTDVRRRLPALKSAPLRVLLALIAVILLGIPLGIWPTNSARFLMEDYGMTLVLLLLTAVSVRSAQDVALYAWLHVLGATIYSGSVLLFGVADIDGRLAGLAYYDANDLAYVLVCTLPLAVYFFRKEESTLKRAIAVTAVVLLTLTIVRTGSRGGFIGFVVAMGYILLQFKAIKPWTRVTAAAVGVLVLIVVGSDTYWSRVATLLRPADDYNWSESTLSGRRAIWSRGMGYMITHPLTGVGIRNFSTAEGTLSSASQAQLDAGRGFKWSSPHNSFVQIGAEVGVTGLALFVAALIVTIRTMARIRRQRTIPGQAVPPDAALAGALVGALLAYCAAGFFLSQAYSSYLYSLFGMGLALAKLYPERPRQPSAAHRRARSFAPRATPETLPATNASPAAM
jgi:O-antigen ligase